MVTLGQASLWAVLKFETEDVEKWTRIAGANFVVLSKHSAGYVVRTITAPPQVKHLQVTTSKPTPPKAKVLQALATRKAKEEGVDWEVVKVSLWDPKGFANQYRFVVQRSDGATQPWRYDNGFKTKLTKCAISHPLLATTVPPLIAQAAPPCGSCRNDDHTGAICPFQKWCYEGISIKYGAHVAIVVPEQQAEGAESSKSGKNRKRKHPEVMDIEDANGSGGNKQPRNSLAKNMELSKSAEARAIVPFEGTHQVFTD